VQSTASFANVRGIPEHLLFPLLPQATNQAGAQRTQSFVNVWGISEKPQYISLKKVFEANKADSQAHIDSFYLYHIELKIP
jgi:hypothetical protein